MLSKSRTSARRYEVPAATAHAHPHTGISLSQYKVWLPSTKGHDSDEDRVRAAAVAAARDRERVERAQAERDRQEREHRDRARREREQREQDLQHARQQERDRMRAAEQRDRSRVHEHSSRPATTHRPPQPTSRPSYSTPAVTAPAVSAAAVPVSSSSHPQQWHPGWAGPGQQPSLSSLSSVGSHIYSTAPTSVSSSFMSMASKHHRLPSSDLQAGAAQSSSWRSSADRSIVDRAVDERVAAVAAATRAAARGSTTSLASADSGSANHASQSRADQSVQHWSGDARSSQPQPVAGANSAFGSRSTEIHMPADSGHARRGSFEKTSRRDDSRKPNGYLSDLTETEEKTPRMPVRSPAPPPLPFPGYGPDRSLKAAPPQSSGTLQLLPAANIPSRGVSPIPTAGSRSESRLSTQNETALRPSSAWSQYSGIGVSAVASKALPADDEVVVQKTQRTQSTAPTPAPGIIPLGRSDPMPIPIPMRRSTYSGQASRDSQGSSSGYLTPTGHVPSTNGITQHMNNSRSSLSGAPFSPTPPPISRVPSNSAFIPTPATVTRVPSNSAFTPTPATTSRVPSNSTFVPTPATASRAPPNNAFAPVPVALPRVPSNSTFVPTPAQTNITNGPSVLAQIRPSTHAPHPASTFQSPASTRPPTAQSGSFTRLPVTYATPAVPTAISPPPLQQHASYSSHGATQPRAGWTAAAAVQPAHGHTHLPPVPTPSPIPAQGSRPNHATPSPPSVQPTGVHTQYKAVFADTAHFPAQPAAPHVHKGRVLTPQPADDTPSSDDPAVAGMAPRASSSTSRPRTSHSHSHSVPVAAPPPPAPEPKRRSASGFFNSIFKPKKYEIWDPNSSRSKSERKAADSKMSDKESGKESGKESNTSKLYRFRSSTSSARPEPAVNVLKKEAQDVTTSSHRRSGSGSRPRDTSPPQPVPEPKETGAKLSRSQSAQAVPLAATIPTPAPAPAPSRSHSHKQLSHVKATIESRIASQPTIYRASSPSRRAPSPERRHRSRTPSPVRRVSTTPARPSAMVPGGVSDHERVRERERIERQRDRNPPTAPVPIPSGRRSPMQKLPFKLLSSKKRVRTVSSASLDVLDGEMPLTVVNSPASSVRSPTPGASPPLRDSRDATVQWRDQEETELRESGRVRRRRPGVTFDVGFDESPMAGDRPRPRSKMKGTPRFTANRLPTEQYSDDSSDEDDDDDD